MKNIIRKIGFLITIVFVSFIIGVNNDRIDASGRVGFDFSKSTTTYLTTPKRLYTHTYIPNTVEAWINIPTSVTGRAGHIIGNYPEANSFGFEIFDGYPRIYWNSGEFDWKLSETNKTTGFQVHTGNWVYVAFVREFVDSANDVTTPLDKKANTRFTVHVYKNGVWSTATKTGSSTNIAVNNFAIGRDKRTSSYNPFRGKIADIRIHRQPRTATAIKAGYENINYAPNVGWYKLDEGQNAIQFKDSGTRQNHAHKATFKTTTRNGKTVVDDWVTYTKPSYFGQSPDDFSMIFVGDPQSISHLSETRAGITDVYKSMGTWTKNNKAAYNIQFLNVLGDVTWYNSKRDNGVGSNNEWGIARATWGQLNGHVPYILNPGNHDYYRRVNAKPWYYTYRDLTDMNKTFPASEYTKWDSFGGAYEEGDIGNVYHKFIVGEYKYLIMGLEFFPRDDVLKWANEVVARHPDYRVIVTTHGYLGGTGYRSTGLNDTYSGGLVAGDTPYGEGDISNRGQGMWDYFIKKHSNIFMVVSGHVIEDNITYRVDKGINGNEVYQFLINPQGLDADDIRNWNGKGYGLIANFMFSNGGKTIDVNYYSPSKNKSYRACNQFTFNVEYADSPEMTAIAMDTLPFKTNYLLGEPLDVAGGKILVKSAVSTANKSIYLTDEMISGYNKDKAGSQTVTVTYGGKKTTFKVTVGVEKLNELITDNLGVLTSRTYLGETESAINSEVLTFGEEIYLDIDEQENYKFLALVENNFLLKNTFNFVDRSMPYNISVDTNLNIIYKPANKHAVIFVDSNDIVLNIMFVDDNSSITDLSSIDTSMLVKSSNLFIGWDHDLTNIKEDLIVTAVYEKDSSNAIFNNNYNLTINDGTAYSSLYKYGEVATIYPTQERVFVGWMNEGKIISRDRVYKFTVLNDITLTALYEDDNYEDLPIINLNSLKNLNNKASFVGNYYLPNEYEVIEAGVILKKSLIKEDLTLNSNEIVTVKVISVNNNSEFMVSIKNDIQDTVLQGRAYLTFKEKGSNKLYTVYSNTTYHSYVDAYVVPNEASMKQFIEVDQTKIFTTIAAAINANKKSICLLPGEYNDALTINKSGITLFSLNKGKKGYSTNRLDEAIIKKRITLTKDANNLIIDGLAFTLDGQIYASNVNGLSNFTFINNNVYDSNLPIDSTKIAFITVASSDAPTEAVLVTSGVKPAFLKNVVNNFKINDNYFGGFTSNYISLWGINNLDVKNNIFDKGMEAVRTHYSQGALNIIGNEFIGLGMDDYGPNSYGKGNGAFTMMIQQTLNGVLTISHNIFDNTAGADSYMTAIRFYLGPTATKVTPSNLIVNITHNSFLNIVTLSNNASNYNTNYVGFINDANTITGNLSHNYYDDASYTIRINGADTRGTNIFQTKAALEANINNVNLSNSKLDQVFIVGNNNIKNNEAGQQLIIKTNLSNYYDVNNLFYYHSSNENVAVVDDAGYVTAVTNGTVTITAIAKNNPNLKASIKITVAAPTNVLAVGFTGVTNGSVILSNGLRYKVTNTYTTIKAAVDAAAAGSTILVNSGTYKDAFTVSKNNINIISINADKNPNKDDRAAEAIITGIITLGTASSTTTGFTLNGFSLTGAARILAAGKVHNFKFINNSLYSSNYNDTHANAIIKLGTVYSTTAADIKSKGIKQVSNVIISNNKVNYASSNATKDIAIFVNIYGIHGENNFIENNDITGGGITFLMHYLIGDVYIQGNNFYKVGKAMEKGGHPIYISRSGVSGTSNAIIRYNIFNNCRGQASLYPMIRNYQGEAEHYIAPINFKWDISHNLFINLTNKTNDGYYLYYGASKTISVKFLDNYVDSAAYHFRDGVLANDRGLALSNTSIFAAAGKVKHKIYDTGTLSGTDALLNQTLVSYHLISGSGANINNLNNFNKLYYLQRQKDILDNNPAT